MNTKNTIAVLIAVILFAVPGLNHGLWLPDEPRVAGICSEMARTGDFLIPHLNGEAFLEKPPLYFAGAALFSTIMQTGNEVPYRLASLFFGLLAIGLTFGMASRRHGRIAGVMAAGILASSWGFFRISRWILVDSALVFGVSLSLFAYLELQERSSVGRAVLFGAGVGLSFLAKGFVGPAMICAAIAADVIRTKDLGILSRLRPVSVLAVVCTIIAAWIGVLFAEGGGDFVRHAIYVNNFMRFTGAPEAASLGHHNGMFYYLDLLPEGLLPWTLLFIPALVSAVKNFRHNPYISWVIGPLILLSLASTKRGIYLVPLFPAVALMVASWLKSYSGNGWGSALIKITWGIAVVGSLLPFAGLFLGTPWVGLAAGGCSLACLLFSKAIQAPQTQASYRLRLIAVMYVGMIASTTVYFSVMTPQEDFLSFTREALTLAGDEKVSILDGDELFAGIVPLVTGQSCPEVDRSAVPPGGLYLWASRYDNRRSPLIRAGKVEILFERKLGSRRAVLAAVTSRGAESPARSRQEEGSRLSSKNMVFPKRSSAPVFVD